MRPLKSARLVLVPSLVVKVRSRTDFGTGEFSGVPMPSVLDELDAAAWVDAPEPAEQAVRVSRTREPISAVCNRCMQQGLHARLSAYPAPAE
ncbi:hypothetical protein GCM10027572_20490 [Flexivirga lutea]